MLLIQVYLLLGYTVASPDYEGPDAAFAAGRLEGMGVLDGMRAVKNYGKNVGFTTPDPAIVGLGYSGGAIATGWAASLQSQYASELNVKGWAMGGPPANLSGTFMQIDGTVFSGFVPIALAGLNKPSAYGAELKPVFDQIATEAGREALEFVNHNCVIADLINFAGESLLTTEYQSLGPNLLANEELDRVLSHNLMGSNSSETPKVPTFVYHATEDQVIPYENTEALVDTWCGDGVNLNFTTFAAGGHLTTEVIALPDVVGFIANAFEGTKATGCSRTTNLADALNPIALGVGLEPILIQLVNALLVLGDGDSNVMNDIGMLRKTMKL
jgi:pimeloyl-ACP methyl ester carboxylesterase